MLFARSAVVLPAAQGWTTADQDVFEVGSLKGWSAGEEDDKRCKKQTRTGWLRLAHAWGGLVRVSLANVRRG